MIHGRNLKLTINGTELGDAKTCSVDCNTSFLPVASPTSGMWEKVTPELNSWKISSECLMVSAATFIALFNAWQNNNELTVRFFDTTFGINLTGSVFVENLDANGSIGSLGRYSVSLRGNGALAPYEGTVITPTVLTTKTGWYYDDTGQGSFDPLDDAGAYVQGLQFTLPEATIVRVYPYDFNVMLGTNLSLITAIQNKNVIEEGQDYSQVVTGSVADLQLAAGTYYVCFNCPNDTGDEPKLINLGQ